MTQYHVTSNGQQFGPFLESEVQSMLANGAITKTDLCWAEGMAEWKPIHEIFARPTNFPPPPPPPHQVHTSKASASLTINWIPALALYCVTSAASILISLVEQENEEAAEGLALLALPLMILDITFFSILHYQCWRALPERFRAITPGKAVGYLFIPFYNFYWAFISWPKLAEGLVEWQKSVGRPTVTDVRSLAVTYAVIFVCTMTVSLIPGFDILIGIGDLVLFIILYLQIVTAINEMK
jgi:hypothetical protein